MMTMFPRPPDEPDVLDWVARKAIDKVSELITGQPVFGDEDDDDGHRRIPPGFETV